MADLKALVKFTEESMPAMKACWSQQYKDGYKARIQNKPRRTHHARRRGMWFNGWDDADKNLSNGGKLLKGGKDG